MQNSGKPSTLILQLALMLQLVEDDVLGNVALATGLR